MERKLNYAKIAEIVQSAIREHQKEFIPISQDALLGELLPEPHDRHSFRLGVHSRVATEGIHVGLDQIPMRPQLAVRDVVATLCDLAGDPGIGGERLSGGGDEEEAADLSGDPTVGDP